MTAMDDKATIKVIKECCQEIRRGQTEAVPAMRNLAWSIDALATMLGERLDAPERKMAPSMRAEPHAPTVPIRRELLPVLEMACKVCRDLCQGVRDYKFLVPDNVALIVDRARQVCEHLDAENGLTNIGASPLSEMFKKCALPGKDIGSPPKEQLLATAIVGRAPISFQVPLTIKQGETWCLGLVMEIKDNKISQGCCVSASRQVDGVNPIEERNQALEEMHKKSKPPDEERDVIIEETQHGSGEVPEIGEETQGKSD